LISHDRTADISTLSSIIDFASQSDFALKPIAASPVGDID
jgi:hypothetical protein